MKSENIFCVYFDKGMCSLQTTTLDIQGICQEGIIYVSIPEKVLNKSRKEFIYKSLASTKDL